MPSDPIMSIFVARLALRSRLTRAERDALYGWTASIETVAAHHDIVEAGEPAVAACLVLDGLVGGFGQARDGTRQITQLYIPGDMPDLHSVALPRASASLVALSATTLIRVPHSLFPPLLTKFPGLAEAFWRDCMVDAGIAAEWLLNLGRRDARARLAHLFCEMAVRYAAIGRCEGDSFTFPINQNFLAEATGMTSIHVNRTLRDLREGGMLDVRGAHVTILDRAALIRTGEFDPAYLMLDVPPMRMMPQ